MLKETLDMLTSHSTPKKVCAMGNVAIARGAIEAGVSGVFSYPGTPSTEISEVFKYVHEFQRNRYTPEEYPDILPLSLYFEYSINEKVALEKAIAWAIAHGSALCVMKNVGLNVASDALMSIPYQIISGPLVVVVCDDPGCHSSSNEQDSRYWALMASVPLFDPATPEEALQMTRAAFNLSKQLQTPVILRTTTRVSHSRGVLHYGAISLTERNMYFEKLKEHINVPARTADAHKKLLEKLQHQAVLKAAESFVFLKNSGAELGVIGSGIAIMHLQEALINLNAEDKVTFLQTGLFFPFADTQITNFLKAGYPRILIAEELDPILEQHVRVLAQKAGVSTEILGKGDFGITPYGEWTPDLAQEVVKGFLKINNPANNLPIKNIAPFTDKLAPRPPVLCAGCPHRATFYLLKLVIPREDNELVLCGDIGCFGLGALPPLAMIDTINHMGMSISMAQGLNEAFRQGGKARKVLALLGDGTFFHSGLTALVNAVYTKANILVIIFDNRTVGMTGHQSNPGAARVEKYREIDIAKAVKGLGIECVEEFNPFELKTAFEKLDKAMQHFGVSVAIAKAPCIFLPEFVVNAKGTLRIMVDPNRCNSCANHEDPNLHCSRCYAPKSNLSRARAKMFAEVQVAGAEQACPANICNHGFFNSILEGDYASAVEVVRDKMLFAHTCGDICHRPCELFSDRSNPIPIKALKKFVSENNSNYKNFEKPFARVVNALKKSSRVAVVGAGPAGLSAAYDLVQAGYQVEVFDKAQKPGGMITHVIPGFRMEKESLRFEATKLSEMGVKFHYSKALGIDITLKSLSTDFEAVILAIGMWKSKLLHFPNAHFPVNNHLDALAFLSGFNMGTLPDYEGDVLVVGGGNSAIDAARAAKKHCPNSKVILVCIEPREQMPAFKEEIDHAVEEGVTLLDDAFISEVSIGNSRDFTAHIHRYTDKKPIGRHRVQLLISAIGQEGDASAYSEIGKSGMDERGRIQHQEGFSGWNNVYVAGDLSAGNHMSLIGAIASGKRAANAVRRKLEAYPYPYEGKAALDRLNTTQPKTKAISKTTGLNPIDGIEKYSLYQSCEKCNHCIDNFGCPAMIKIGGKVVIDEARCTLCGLCIDVCPNDAIRWDEVVEPAQTLTP
jgi:indolepyruvate ferredoxin oxidoreductase alpha subunit